MAAALALAGYGAVTGAPSAGHGFRLATHVAAEHREAVEALVFGAEHEEPYGPAHGQDEESEPAEPAAGDVHTHDGRAHSHREAPPPPAFLTVALDKHCVPPRCAVPAPLPARGADAATPAEAHVPVVLPVEVRPPQRRA